MLQTRFTVKAAIMGTIALTASLLASCGPPSAVTTSEGPSKQVTMSAIAVSEISPDGAATSRVSLSWTDLPSETTTLSVYRILSSSADGATTRISNGTYDRGLTLDDKDTNLVSGSEYKYTLKGFNQKDINVVQGASNAVTLINATNVPAFNMLKPAKENDVLISATTDGYQFSWEDAGTGLYHVQVTDASGKVLWGAITKNTAITYGQPSGTDKQNGITTRADDKLKVPLALADVLKISSGNPDTSRKEVAYQGINNGTFKIQVSALETQPDKGNLSTARSIAIRHAKQVGFIAQ